MSAPADFYYGYERPALPDPGGRLSVALVFPGPERAALSTLGWQAVYRLLASRPEFRVARFHADDRERGRAVSPDTADPLSLFPVVALSLNFEEEYLPALSMLRDAGLPDTAAERPDWPLVLAGGPLMWLNPAPFVPALDAVFAGEAEAGLLPLFLALREAALAGTPKAEALSRVAGLPGVYVPGVSALPVRRAVALEAGAGDRALAEPAWSCFIDSKAEFADMLLLEVNRGCPYGCRFCAAGFLYRPPRQASLTALQRIVEAANPPKVGLVGTALTDWPHLAAFLEWLAARKTKFSLSSLRADGITPELLTFLRRHGLRTVTLALEAASRRLRLAANKNLREDDFLRAVRLCAEHGVNRLKLYCIIGWPDETEADYDELEGFLALLQEARAAGRGGKKGKASGIELVTLSLSALVPKPWTPLQWARMATEADIEARVKRVRAMVKPLKGFSVEADPPFGARLQGYLARAGVEGFAFIRSAADLGGWRRAAKADRDRFAAVLDRERGEAEAFPWEVIDQGISRAHLWREWQRYLAAAATPACPAEGCARCTRCGLPDWLQASPRND